MIIDSLFASLAIDPSPLRTAAGMASRSPIDGTRARARASDERRGPRRRDRAREVRAAALAIRAGAAPRRARAAVRQRVARREERARHARHARDGQAPAGRPGRSAGDDRHLRLRGRAVASAARPHHRLRAARPSHARDVASVRRVRRHLRVQLSRSRCGRGTQHSRSRAATRSCGSRRRRRR